MTADAPSAATTEPERAARSRQVPAISAALVVLALILGIIVAPGGPGGLVLQSFNNGNLALLVPAGWKNEGLVAPHGTSVSGWFNLANPADSETVQASEPAGGTPAERGRALARRLPQDASAVQSYTVTFPGGRPAWLLLYKLQGAPYAVFEFDVCTPAIAMTVTLSASSPGRLKTYEDGLPAGAAAICKGAAFSSPDRADLAIPLALPS
ncbi:MAG: hypothetical protein ABSG64_12050 [Solirubrobacteraceae bacterium]|jgi:hypothetical protein